MIVRLDPVRHDQSRELTTANKHVVRVPGIGYILAVYAYGSDHNGYLHCTKIGEVAYDFPSMVLSAYDKLAHELTVDLGTRDISIVSQHCVCHHTHNESLTSIRSKDLTRWTCDKCCKPTYQFIKHVMMPRDIGDLRTYAYSRAVISLT